MHILKHTNWLGLYTLSAKEIGRFMKVHAQTISAPIVTALLYYMVFAIALGGSLKEMAGVPFLAFLAPGLVLMTMVQNAFANTSSSLIIGKVQGNIVDILLPPLSPGELLTGFLVGGVARALVVGIPCAITFWVLLNFYEGHSWQVQHWWAVLAYGFLGSLLLALLGVLGGLWASRFDNMAAVQNFVIMPATFLSGTFYSVAQLSPEWQFVLHLNPFFYMIDGFRYGFIGVSDGTLGLGLTVLVAVNVLLVGWAYLLFARGYKIKN